MITMFFWTLENTKKTPKKFGSLPVNPLWPGGGVGMGTPHWGESVTKGATPLFN